MPVLQTLLEAGVGQVVFARWLSGPTQMDGRQRQKDTQGAVHDQLLFVPEDEEVQDLASIAMENSWDPLKTTGEISLQRGSTSRTRV